MKKNELHAAHLNFLDDNVPFSPCFQSISNVRRQIQCMHDNDPGLESRVPKQGKTFYSILNMSVAKRTGSKKGGNGFIRDLLPTIGKKWSLRFCLQFQTTNPLYSSTPLHCRRIVQKVLSVNRGSLLNNTIRECLL